MIEEEVWASFFRRCDGFSDRHSTSESVKFDNFLFIETLTLSKSSDVESLRITIEKMDSLGQKNVRFLFVFSKFKLIYLLESHFA